MEKHPFSGGSKHFFSPLRRLVASPQDWDGGVSAVAFAATPPCDEGSDCLVPGFQLGDKLLTPAVFFKAVVDAGKKTVVPGVLPTDYRPYKLIAFSNVQFLDVEFTESALLQPGTDHTIVGNTPAFAPDFLLKGGISFQREHCFNIALTAVYVSQQFWQDTDIGNPAIPKGKIPPYSVFNLSAEFYLNTYVRLIGGISNLTDAKYYDRVFANGIEPAPRLSGYAGLSLSF